MREREREREKEREREEGAERERERERIPSRLCTVSSEPNMGFRFMSYEITT